MGFQKGHISWCKGLTKETDERIRLRSIKISLALKGRKHSKEHIEKIRISKLGKPSHRKGKSLEEEYGIERAKEIREKIRMKAIGRKLSEETKRKISESMRGANNPFYGRHHSEETKRLLSIKCSMSTLKRLFENPSLHPNVLCSKNKKVMSRIERIIYNRLEKDGVLFIHNFRVGRRFVDFCLPEAKLLVECDGEFWHNDIERETSRDKEILNAIGEGWAIIHLHENFIRMTEEQLKQESQTTLDYFIR